MPRLPVFLSLSSNLVGCPCIFLLISSLRLVAGESEFPSLQDPVTEQSDVSLELLAV